MSVRIIIEDVPEDLGRELVALLAGRREEVTVTTTGDWTPARAKVLVRSLPARTAAVLRLVVEGDGWVDSETLRAGRLIQGPSTSLTATLKTGAEQGHWPHDIAPPLLHCYNPEKKGYSQLLGYEMPPEILAAFRPVLGGPTEPEADSA